MSSKIVDRGTLIDAIVGPLTVTYLSGKDAGEQDPVFDMSVGEVMLINSSDSPVDVKYDSEQTFFSGHRYEFGSKGEGTFHHPHIHRYDLAADVMELKLAVGEELLISRQDLMDLVARVTTSALLDGTITTHYHADITINGVMREIDFGPHRFHIAMKRDWKAEEQNYLDFFAKRDGR